MPFNTFVAGRDVVGASLSALSGLILWRKSSSHLFLSDPLPSGEEKSLRWRGKGCEAVLLRLFIHHQKTFKCFLSIEPNILHRHPDSLAHTV